MTNWEKPNQEMMELLWRYGWDRLENVVVSVTSNFLTFRDNDTNRRIILPRFEV